MRIPTTGGIRQDTQFPQKHLFLRKEEEENRAGDSTSTQLFVPDLGDQNDVTLAWPHLNESKSTTRKEKKYDEQGELTLSRRPVDLTVQSDIS